MKSPKTIHEKIFLILLITLSTVFIVMISSYLNAIILAYISSLILYPLYKNIYEKIPHNVKKKEVIASSATVIIALIAVLTPIITIISVSVAQATELANNVSDAINQYYFENTINSINESIRELPISNMPTLTPENIAAFVQYLSQIFISFATKSLPKWGSSAMSFITNFVIYIVMLAYMIPSVKKIYNFILKVIPLDLKYTKNFINTANTITVDMLKGIFIVAIVQGFLVWLAFVVLDTPYTMLLSLISTLLAIIPYVGTGLITIPVAIIYAISGDWISAIILTIWQVAVISTSDNIIRSKLLANKSKVSLPFALLGILGGLKMFGLLGLIYGPLILTLLITTINIYIKEFTNIRPKKTY